MDAVHRATKRIRDRLNNMVGRAVLSAIDDKEGIQLLQLEGMAEETHDRVERLQDYGFTSHPKPGAEAAVVYALGLRSHGLVVALGDRRYRLKELKEGEVAVYDDQGQKVHITREGVEVKTSKKVMIEAEQDVLIKSASKVTVEAPQVIVDSDDVKLADGGAAVARVGDSVSCGGTITSGSAKVECG